MDRLNSLPTSMNYPATVEERESKPNLIHEGSGLLLGYGWLVFEHVVEHVLEIRPSDLKYQHIMFPVRALHLEIIQGTEDTVISRMRPWFGRKMTINLDLHVPARESSHGKLEGNISAT
jgi:hypothetical protein